MLMADRERKITLVNRAMETIFGYSREELIGQPIEMLVPKRFRAEHSVYVAGYFKEPKTRLMGAGRELYGLRKDGGEVAVEIGLNPIETPEGLFTVASVVDITERKRIVNELEQFAYAVSHDLRQPLRGITGFCKMLVEDYEEKLEPGAQRYIRTIVESAEQMGQLIDDLLKLSRISREQMVFETVDISALCHQAANDLRESDPARQVDVKIEEGLTAKGDPRLLKLLLQNLIGNAWKFTAKAGNPQISIGRRTNNGTDAFFIADNGVGFNMKYADKLFGPFQRLHKAAEFEGTGIGLATVQRIVNRHGGRIWAEAEEGKGASFYFSW
jgi:PAS domain S-box-containing protein